MKKNLRRLRAICQHPDLKNSKFNEKDNSVRLLAELAFVMDEITEINNLRKKTRNHRQVKIQILIEGTTFGRFGILEHFEKKRTFRKSLSKLQTSFH